MVMVPLLSASVTRVITRDHYVFNFKLHGFLEDSGVLNVYVIFLSGFFSKTKELTDYLDSNAILFEVTLISRYTHKPCRCFNG